MSDKFDVVVLGGGAGGLGAARAARWEGASVALISDGKLGGDCTWTGCVPSKAMIEASRDGSTFAQGIERVRLVTTTVGAAEDPETLRHEGVEVIEARGTFVAPLTIEVDGRTVSATTVVIGTGSTPSVPPIDGLAEVDFVTNEAFFDAREQPSSMIVIGAGPIGCELGEAMQRFGTQVTLLEYGPRVLGRFEPDASALVQAGLQSVGVEVIVDARIERVEQAGTQITVVMADGTTHVADELLVAAGRTPSSRGLGLEAAGVETDDGGFITTDKWLRTSQKSTFAVGDVNGKQMLSHAADEMGRISVWTALRRGRRYGYDRLRIPQVVFTTPEVASIGVLEADAPDDARVAEAPMHINDRALAAERPEGFVRLIAKPGVITRHKAGGRLIGATIVGGHAGELINEAALIMRSGAYAGRLAQTVRAYPSWSTIMQKAAARWFYDIEGQGARPPRK